MPSMIDQVKQRLARLGVWLLEHVPAWLAALVVMPMVSGMSEPWAPTTAGLRTMWVVVHQVLAGEHLYEIEVPSLSSGFDGPPLLVLLVSPLALGTWFAWQLIWPGLQVIALVSILRRLNLTRSWLLGATAACVVLVLEPLRTGLGTGDLTVIVAALVTADLLPAERARRLPQGALVGLAAAATLRPIWFIVFALIVGRRLTAGVAVATAAVVTAAAWWILPQAGGDWWDRLLDSSQWRATVASTGTQSLPSALTAYSDSPADFSMLALAVGVSVGAIGVVVAARRWRGGCHLEAIGLVGLAAGLAAPSTTSAQQIWVLVLIMGWLITRRRPNVLMITWAGWLALYPPAVIAPLAESMAALRIGPFLGTAALLLEFSALLSGYLTARPRGKYAA